jgi:hypothetical protein
LNKLEFSLSKDNFFALSLIEFGQLVMEKKIFNNFQCILTLLLLSPLGEGLFPLLEQIWILSLKGDLCQAWLKLAQWFWRRRFWNYPTPFSHFCDYLPFEEDLTLNLNKLEFPSSKDNLY